MSFKNRFTNLAVVALPALLAAGAALADHGPGRPGPGGPGPGPGPGRPGNGEDYRGRQAAERACQKLNNQYGTNRCLQAIHATRSFDVMAAEFCASEIRFFTDTDTVIGCLTAIGDKDYDIHELDRCKMNRPGGTDQDKIQCLRTSGRPSYDPGRGGRYDSTCGFLTVEDVQNDISTALRYIRNPEAIRILQNLQYDLDRRGGRGRRF